MYKCIIQIIDYILKSQIIIPLSNMKYDMTYLYPRNESTQSTARLHDIPSTIILTMSSGPSMVYKIIPSQWNYEGNMLMA